MNCSSAQAVGTSILSKLHEVPGSARRLFSARWDFKTFKAGIAFCHLPLLPQIPARTWGCEKTRAIIHLKFSHLGKPKLQKYKAAYKCLLNRDFSVLYSEKLTVSASVTHPRYLILFPTVLFWNSNIIILGFGANESTFQSLNSFSSCFTLTRDWLLASIL